MIVVPAIDIRGGKCVRLVQGDYARETVFSDDPAAMALRWVREGARVIHLVDLDGARSGKSDNRDAVEAIVAEIARMRTQGGLDDRVCLELGGGIRDLAAVEYWLGGGIDRVILGTVAVTKPEIVSEAAARFPGCVWVGIDARCGKVAVSGWTEGTQLDAITLARDAQERGASGIIYTDIDRDGTGRGVNAEATVGLSEILDIPVYASGGVSSVDDVKRLATAGDHSVAGVIVGRALYDGAVTLADMLAGA